MIRKRLLASALLACLPFVAQAQTVRVVAGEHAEFTRMVLRVPAGVEWSVEGTGAERIFATQSDLAYDLSGVFDRIPRTRLSAVRIDPAGLVLDLACDCPVRAWQDRPGLVVIDISNPTNTSTPADTVEEPPPTPLVFQRVEPVFDPAAAARAAGEQLARTHAEASADGDEMSLADDSQALTDLAEDLGRQVAQALGQGLLDPSIETSSPRAVLRPDGEETELPPNMRVVDVTERPTPDAPPDPVPDSACRGAEALEFLLGWDGPPFLEGLSQYGQALFGEFDQASEQGFLDLIEHYLAAGLGAEARSLITNLRDPLPGRDMLLGFSDVLEGRMSNSRMRLAEAARCGGAAAIGAVLAHPDAVTLPDLAASVALSFGQLPPVLRATLGADLVEALVAAGTRDEARIVADSLRQSPWAVADEIVLVDALLEGDRGDPVRAATQLDSIAMRSIEGTLAWLELAISEDTEVAPSALDDAEALATENRGSELGIEIMAATIRLRARSAQPDEALVALDRLETWAGSHASSRPLVAALRDEIWSQLAQTADDHALLALTLARSDWLEPALSLTTRQELANRLVDLGFAAAAERLLAPEADAQSLRLRAAAALNQNDTDTALRLIEDDTSTEAVEIRAASASRAGDHAEAAALLDAAGIVDAAARAAILDGDWRRLDDLRRRGASPEALPQDANGFLGRAPGIAEISYSSPAVEAREPSAESGLPTETPGEPNWEQAIERPPSDSLAEEAALDPGEVLDRMGLVSRAGLLLAESERLRDAIGQTLERQQTR